MSHFSVEGFLTQAREITGLSDFGEQNFLEPLRRFLASCEQDACLNEQGVQAVNGQVVKALVNRLRFEDALKKHPEILDIDIDDPLIIIGLPRVGSTKLHRALAANPNVHSFPFWQLLNPAPFPNAEACEEDPRIAVAKNISDHLLAASPDFFAGYMPIADYPDEDQWLLDLTFMQAGFIITAVAKSYIDWFAKQDMTWVFAYMKRLMQYLVWQSNAQGKPLVLKAPAHTLHLDILAKLFPKAKFVQPHRDPTQVVASLVNLIVAGASANSTQDQSASISRLYGGFTMEIATKGLALRKGIGEERFYDIYYDDVRDDVLGVVKKVHQFWGVPLTAEGKQIIQQWDAQQVQHKHGHFQYTMENALITPEQVLANTRPYLERFFPDLVPQI